MGEVGSAAFAVSPGALSFWEKRAEKLGLNNLKRSSRFGKQQLEFSGPDGDDFVLVEVAEDTRKPWGTEDIPEEAAILGFHSATLNTPDSGALLELMKFMNYEILDNKDGITRLSVEAGNGAHVLDIKETPSAIPAAQGAGSVHHIAFAVEDRAAQLEVRKALMDTGYSVTPVIDRDYFWAIYFRTPEGILFEVATNEPGFDRDEDTANLGEALKLPTQHAHLREVLEKNTDPDYGLRCGEDTIMSWNPTLEPGCPDTESLDSIETLIIPRSRDLGGFEVRRALPSPKRQMVGPFIFFDQAGPA